MYNVWTYINSFFFGNKKVYKTKEEIQVVKLLESIPREELKEMSIIDIEDKFYENYEG